MKDAPSGFAVKLANRIERRRFLRLSSQAAFIGAAGLAAGAGLDLVRSPKAYANPCGVRTNVPGLGCPSGGKYGYAPCGPSPCCDHYGSGPCNCANPAVPTGGCKSTGYCKGAGFYYSGTNCWACGVHYGGALWVTTCCDCEYKSAYYNTCKPSSGKYFGRCIAWWTDSP